MVYGILIESIVQFINENYGRIVVERVERLIDFKIMNLHLFEIYDDRLMFNIAEGIFK